jgi:hypothetical protein
MSAKTKNVKVSIPNSEPTAECRGTISGLLEVIARMVSHGLPTRSKAYIFREGNSEAAPLTLYDERGGKHATVDDVVIELTRLVNKGIGEYTWVFDLAWNDGGTSHKSAYTATSIGPQRSGKNYLLMIGVESQGYRVQLYRNGLECLIFIDKKRVPFHWMLDKDAIHTLGEWVSGPGIADVKYLSFTNKEPLIEWMASMSKYATVGSSEKTSSNGYTYRTRPATVKEQTEFFEGIE